MRGREVTPGGLRDLSVSGSLSLQSERAVLAARHAAFHVTQDGDCKKKGVKNGERILSAPLTGVQIRWTVAGGDED